MSNNVTHATDDSFGQDVLEADQPVIVDFWASWCQPCLQFAPILEEIADEYAGKIKVVKVDVDANPDVARDYNVVSIPTINVYTGGELSKSLVGSRPKKKFLDEISEYIA
ncbi:thioredoxin [Occultella gossypii]|uniref:Thioredoxin n=1 Tax=Occultella gossypii TaxID=2800820 RepID=A0ABS7S9J2_9MICO|nr:thioredoxin [Occultella gossypii]MBZ2197012.1 thioredoxin [Occultella gossypii]